MATPEKFEAFVLAYQDMVYSTAYRLLANEVEAEDVSQQAFLRAWNHFDEIAESPTAGGWMKTVTRNLALNHLTRYRNRWRFFSELKSEDDSEASFEENSVMFSTEGVLEKTLLTSEQRQTLEQAIAKLPTDQRTALVLYHFDGLDYAEIARHLGVSLGKVKTDIHRARNTLKKKLQPIAEELGV